MAIKFADHLLWIARGMNQTGPEGMWDEEDGFYYDVLRLPDGTAQPAKGSLHGGTAAALRDHCYRALAAGTGTAERIQVTAGTIEPHARIAQQPSSYRA